jgi:hypothetical protein
VGQQPHWGKIQTSSFKHQENFNYQDLNRAPKADLNIDV